MNKDEKGPSGWNLGGEHAEDYREMCHRNVLPLNPQSHHSILKIICPWAEISVLAEVKRSLICISISLEKCTSPTASFPSPTASFLWCGHTGLEAWFKTYLLFYTTRHPHTWRWKWHSNWKCTQTNFIHYTHRHRWDHTGTFYLAINKLFIHYRQERSEDWDLFTG